MFQEEVKCYNAYNLKKKQHRIKKFTNQPSSIILKKMTKSCLKNRTNLDKNWTILDKNWCKNQNWHLKVNKQEKHRYPQQQCLSFCLFTCLPVR